MFTRKRQEVTDPRGQGSSLEALNRRFYTELWSRARLVPPERFSTWPIVSSLAAAKPERLEIAAGLRPRLPIKGTCFLDLSPAALGPLVAVGGRCVCGTAAALPFPDAGFGLIAAFDVIEHVADDEAAFAELARVAADGAALLLSVPLHEAAWSGFDRAVGHARRYEPERLAAILTRHGFTVEQSAPFGMRPRFGWVAALGLWFLAHAPGHAMSLYNRTLLLALRLQKEPELGKGLVACDRADGLLLLCRRELRD